MEASRDPRSNGSLAGPHRVARSLEGADSSDPTDAGTHALADEGRESMPPENVGSLSMLSARVFAKRHGWWIVRLYGVVAGRCECGDDECRHVGKHPRTRRGVKHGSSDDAQLGEWWSAHPNSNLGIATGARSKIFVLDVDGARDGVRALAELEERYGPLPETVRAVTGRGEHVYFQHPGWRVQNTSDKLARGLDIRGDGGLVVAPPSLHATGVRYRWKDGHDPRVIAVAPAPDWLLDKLRPARARSDRENGHVRHDAPGAFAYGFVLDGVPKGSRNWSIFRMASSLRGLGTPPKLIEALALHAAKNCSPPLLEREALTSARSAMRYPTNAEKQARRGLSPERLAILNLLLDTPNPLRPVEVGRLLQVPRERVKMLLSKMARDGQVVRVEGGYRMSFGTFIGALAGTRDDER